MHFAQIKAKKGFRSHCAEKMHSGPFWTKTDQKKMVMGPILSKIE